MHRGHHSAAARVIRTRPVVALAVAAAGLATATWLPSRFDNAEATERDRTSDERRATNDGDRVVFEDRFAGRRGDPADPRTWTAAAGSQDGEVQVFTADARNARLDGDGNLVITARRKWSGEITSARLVTREGFGGAAGRAEARIKVADGQGIRSAFRLLGAEDVDVMGNRGAESKVVRGAFGDEHGSLSARRSFAEDFHTFAVEWEPGRIVWSVDGDEFFRTGRSLDGSFNPSVAVTVGEDHARFPQRMLVDFVRVSVREEKPPATTPPATPATTAPTTPPITPPTSEPARPPATTTPPAPAASPWKPFTVYAAGAQVSFDGITYEVREAHTSLPAWQPPAVPGLFKPL